jgi:hypothetical protein
MRRAIGVPVNPQVNDVLRGGEEDGELVNVRGQQRNAEREKEMTDRLSVCHVRLVLELQLILEGDPPAPLGPGGVRALVMALQISSPASCARTLRASYAPSSMPAVSLTLFMNTAPARASQVARTCRCATSVSGSRTWATKAPWCSPHCCRAARRASTSRTLSCWTAASAKSGTSSQAWANRRQVVGELTWMTAGQVPRAGRRHPGPAGARTALTQPQVQPGHGGRRRLGTL